MFVVRRATSKSISPLTSTKPGHYTNAKRNEIELHFGALVAE